MPNKMLIDATHPEETRVVVVRGNRVEEFDFETAQRKQLRGNIYLAKVTRVEPSLQAAFIEYGGNRHGFLAFSEIHPDYYQIPVADRQALIEADERAHREAEEESENRSNRTAARGIATRAAAAMASGCRARSSTRKAPNRRRPPSRTIMSIMTTSTAKTGTPTPMMPDITRRMRIIMAMKAMSMRTSMFMTMRTMRMNTPTISTIMVMSRAKPSAPESQTEMPVSAAIEASAASPPDAPTDAEVREERT